MSLAIISEPLLDSLNQYHPQLIWGQMVDKYKLLSENHVKLFSAPSSTSGVKRNYKAGNSVMSQLRCILTDFSLQKHVSIAFNGNQLKIRLTTTGGSGFEKVFSSFCDSYADRQPTMLWFIPHISSLDMSELDDEIIHLRTILLDINDPKQISDDLIFFQDS